MSGQSHSSGPKFRCKYLPKFKRRRNAKKSNYSKKIINNFFIGNNFINLNDPNINLYHFEKYTTNDTSSYRKGHQLQKIEKKYDFPLTLPIFGYEKSGEDRVKEENTLNDIPKDTQSKNVYKKTLQAKPPSITSLQVVKAHNSKTITSFYKENVLLNQTYSVHPQMLHCKTDYRRFLTNVTSGLSAVISGGSLQDEIKYINEGTNKLPLRDLTNAITNKMIGRPVNMYLISNSLNIQKTSGNLYKFNKCIQQKTKQNRTISHFTNLKSSSKIFPPKSEPLSNISNDLFSSGASTPRNDKKSLRRNWEISPIFSHGKKKTQNLLNNSEFFGCFESDNYPKENSVIPVLEFSLNEINYDLHDYINESNDIFDGTIKCTNINENINHQSSRLYKTDTESCRSLKLPNDDLDDISEILNSLYLDNIEYSENENKPLETDESTALDGICQHNKNMTSTDIKRDSDGLNQTQNDTYHSIKSSSGFDITNNSLHFFSDLNSSKSSQESNNDSTFNSLSSKQMTSGLNCTEHYTNIVPGKKWRRSLLAAVRNNRAVSLSAEKDHSKEAITNWNIRFSINPQYQFETNFCLKNAVHANKLKGIKEVTSPEIKEPQHQINNIYNGSFIDFDDTVKESEEIDCTLTIHQQVAHVLQTEDLDKTFMLDSSCSCNNKKAAEERVLNLCGLQSPANFKDVYPKSKLRNCKKLGEGLFGEVFCFFCPLKGEKTVLKIIPIEGNKLVNFTPQKTYSEVFSEMCIALSLSSLKDLIDANYTEGFCRILRITCLKGKYPEEMIELWNKFDSSKGSDNDSPTIFDSDQLYIGLEMEHGGEPLESYQFSSARQSYSILLQVIYSLAVAEKAFNFEHRDLHWGNILISKTLKRSIKYVIEGKTYNISTYGKRCTIIDYTLSRIRSGNFDIYNDVGKDKNLFEAYGDYQFDIYRQMREDVKDNWQLYVPKTNVRWIHYLATKCYKGVYYKKCHNIHQTYLLKVKQLRDSILDYNSAADIVESLNQE